MMSTVLLLLMLPRVSVGAESVCDATQSATCYGIRGEPVYLQVVAQATGLELVLKKITQNIFTSILRFNKQQVQFFKESSSMTTRWDFIAMNGTIIINPSTKEDAGTYRVQINNGGKGHIVANITIQLIIQSAHRATTSTLTAVTDNPCQTATHVETSSLLLAASFVVFLLCVAVSGGVYSWRRTLSLQPVETADLEYAEVSVVKRRRQPEHKSGEDANLPAAVRQDNSSPVDVEESMYAQVRPGQ